MSGFASVSERFNVWMNAVAGWILVFMMMLTVVDVVLRLFSTSILGTYELVSVAGALVVGFAIPQTTSEKAHVCVEFFIENRSAVVKNSVLVITRVMGLILFAVLAWNLTDKAARLYRGGEVSLTLHIPYYPAAYGMALCCFVQCLTLISDIFKIFASGGDNK